MRRPTVLVLVLALPLLVTGCAACCEQLTGNNEAKQDNVARQEYFESAALTYYDGGRYDMAITQWRKVLAITPDSKKAKRGLAKSLYMSGAGPGGTLQEKAAKITESEKIFEEIVNLPWTREGMQGGTADRQFEVQLDLALVYAEMGDLYDRVARNVSATMKADPNADEKALQATLDEVTTKRNAKLRKAIPLFNTVLRKSPKNPYAYAGLSKTHLQLGNDEMGIYYTELYLKQSRDSQTNWKKELADYEKLVKGQVPEETRRLFVGKIMGAKQKEKKTWLMLASVHMRRLEFSQAVECYTHVIEIDAAVPAAYVERAQAYGALNEYGRAIADLEEYLKITDPQVHRHQRMNAVELLDRYQAARAHTAGRSVQGASARPGTGNRPANPLR